MLLHEFALATHSVLAVLVSMIKVRRVNAHRNNCSNRQHACCLKEMRHTLSADAVDEETHHHQDLRNEEVISHLHMV